MSRADDAAACASSDQVSSFDGTTVRNETSRLRAALLPSTLVVIGGLDLAADGALVVVVGAQRPGDAESHWELCTLGVAADVCEPLDFSARAVIFEPPRTYVLVSTFVAGRGDVGAVWVRDAGAPWSPLSVDDVIDLRSIEGGGVAFVHTSDDDRWFLDVLAPDGTLESRVERDPLQLLVGHSRRGLWAIRFDQEIDSCARGAFRPGCIPVWAQVVVSHVAADAITEVAHRDWIPGFTSRLWNIPLPDGGLHTEIDGAAYVFAAP